MERMRSRLGLAAFCLATAAAGLAPLLAGRAYVAEQRAPASWPSHYEGRPLTALPMTEREAGFLADFPGRVARFTDGEGEIIIRRVDAATRRLHPAADCLRGAGFNVTPLPARRDAAGDLMSCTKASRTGQAMQVCEVIRNDKGGSWPDASSWYWHALWQPEDGPWWSFVVARAAQ
jgi:hypothetical protein